MTICDDLRQAVLQAAIQGKLTQQLPEDGNATDLLDAIKAEKAALVKAKKIKKEKPQEPIAEDEIPYKIPDGWAWLRFGEFGIYKKGPFGSALTKSIFIPKGDNAVKVYEQKNAIKKNVNIGDYYISEEYFTSKMSGFELLPGDIIVSCAGTIGETYIMPSDMEKGIINQALMRMRMFPSTYIPYFLLYFDTILKQTAKHDSNGSAIKNIPPFEILKNYLVPVPPIAEQQRIVAKVDELMAKIDGLEKTEKELEGMKKAFPGDMKAALLQAAMQGKLTEQLESDGNAADVFKSVKKRTIVEADSQDVDIPQNWEWAILSDICEIYTGNSIAESEKAQKYIGLEEGYDYVATKDVGFNHQVEYDNGVRIPFDSASFRKAHRDATLLCIEGGSAGKKIAILDKEVCFGNKLCMFFSPHLNKNYLYYYLQSPDFTSVFANSVTGIIGGVSIKKLKAMTIPIPPLAEQERIVEKLDKLLPLCDGLVEK